MRVKAAPGSPPRARWRCPPLTPPDTERDWSPPRPPGRPKCLSPLLLTPSFPKAHPAPDARRILVRRGGTVSAGGAFQSGTVPWGPRPGRQELPPISTWPTSSPQHSML